MREFLSFFKLSRLVIVHPFLVFATFASLCLSVHAEDTNGQKKMTNADVIQMVQAHLSSEVIIEQIRSAPGNYLLTPNSLIQLKKAGVPDAVIGAMQTKQRQLTRNDEGTPIAADGPEFAPAQEIVLNRGWQRVEFTDAKTGRKSSYVKIARAVGHPDGKFEVRASCEVNQKFTVSVKSLTTGKALQRSEVPSGYQIPEEGHSGMQCVHMNVYTGIGAMLDYYSSYCDSSDHASIVYLGEELGAKAQQDLINRADEIDGGKRRQLLATCSAINWSSPIATIPTAGNAMIRDRCAGAQRGPSVAPVFLMQKLNDSDTLKIELPFQDGTRSWVELDLTDPEFRSFRASCSSAVTSHSFKPVNSSNGMSSLQKANVDASAGRYAEAVAEYKEALTFDGANQTAKDGLAKANAALEKQQEAERIRQAKEKEAERIQEIPAMLVSAGIACDGGDYASAVKDYNEVLSLDRGNQTALAAMQIAEDRLAKQEKKKAERAAAGMFLDQTTNLLWTSNDNGEQISWKNAKKYCETLRTGGFSDWRIATPGELQALYEDSAARRTAPLKRVEFNYDQWHSFEAGTIFDYRIKDGISLSAPEVWCATRKRDGGYMGFDIFNFALGKEASWADDKSLDGLHRALCRRTNSEPKEVITSCSAGPAESAEK